ncbi:MAG TPA: twin-arginine translocation signal domain-containing protein, partial [Terriglobales bacterium]
MLIKKMSDVPSSEITPQDVYMNRRKFLAGLALTGAAAATGFGLKNLAVPPPPFAAEKINGIQKSP